MGGAKNEYNFHPFYSKGINPKNLNIDLKIHKIYDTKLQNINKKKNIIITVPHKCLGYSDEKKLHLCDLLSFDISKYINNYLLDKKKYNVTHISSKQNRKKIDDNRYDSVAKYVTPLWRECIKKVQNEKIDLHLDVHSFDKNANRIFDNEKYNKKIIILMNHNSLLLPIMKKNIEILNENGIFLHIFAKNYEHIIALHDFFTKNKINSLLLEFNEKYTVDELKPNTDFLLNFLITKLNI